MDRALRAAAGRASPPPARLRRGSRPRSRMRSSESSCAPTMSMRIARVTAAGTRIEADLAQRARDLREKAELRDALTRCRLHVSGSRPRPQEGGPVERAWLAEGKAELARARGRGDPRVGQGGDARGSRSSVPTRSRSRAGARPRRTSTAGDRAAAAPLARAALESANELGSEWLAAEVDGARRTRAGSTSASTSRSNGADGAARRGSVRAHPARAPGAGAGRPGRDQPPDRRGAVHGREDRERPRVADPRQARRAGPHAGGRGRAPPAPRLTGLKGAGACYSLGVRTPAEWEPHDRTLMGWPCRLELWGETIDAGARRLRRGRERGRRVRAGDDDRQPGRGRRAGSRGRVSDGVEIVELPLDDSWLRDCGPIYVYGDDGGRRRRPLPLQRLGREVPALGPRCGRRRTDRARSSATRCRGRRSCSRAARS